MTQCNEDSSLEQDLRDAPHLRGLVRNDGGSVDGHYGDLDPHPDDLPLATGERIIHPNLGAGTVVADQVDVRVKVRWDDTGHVGAPRATVLRRGTAALPGGQDA